MTLLFYIHRPKGWKETDWLEVALITHQPAGDPSDRSVGRAVAAFKFTTDALRYAVAQITPSEAAVNLIFDGAGEVAAVFSDVDGKVSHEFVAKGRVVVAVKPGHADGRSIFGVVVRP